MNINDKWDRKICNEYVMILFVYEIFTVSL